MITFSSLKTVDNEEEDPKKSSFKTEKEGGNVSECSLRLALPERFEKDKKIIFKILEIVLEDNKEIIVVFDSFIQGFSSFSSERYVNLRRNYREFINLWQKLQQQCTETIVPSTPDLKDLREMMKTGSKRFVLLVVQEWIDRVTSNAILVRNREFIYFFEEVEEVRVENFENAQSRDEIFQSVIRTIRGITFQNHEILEFKGTLESTHLQLLEVQRIITSVISGKKKIGTKLYNELSKMFFSESADSSQRNMNHTWNALKKTIELYSILLLFFVMNDNRLLDYLKLLDNECKYTVESLKKKNKLLNYLVQSRDEDFSQKDKNSSQNFVNNNCKQHFNPTNNRLFHKRVLYELLLEKKEFWIDFEKRLKLLFRQYFLSKIHYHKGILWHLELICFDLCKNNQNQNQPRLFNCLINEKKNSLFQNLLSSSYKSLSSTFSEEESSRFFVFWKDPTRDLGSVIFDRPSSSLNVKLSNLLLFFAELEPYKHKKKIFLPEFFTGTHQDDFEKYSSQSLNPKIAASLFSIQI